MDVAVSDASCHESIGTPYSFPRKRALSGQPSGVLTRKTVTASGSARLTTAAGSPSLSRTAVIIAGRDTPDGRSKCESEDDQRQHCRVHSGPDRVRWHELRDALRGRRKLPHAFRDI